MGNYCRPISSHNKISRHLPFHILNAILPIQMPFCIKTCGNLNSPFPLFSFFLFYCNVSFPLLREFVQKNLPKGSLTFLTAAAVISPFSSFPSSPFAKASPNRLSSPGLQLFLTYKISQSSYHDLLPFAIVQKTRKL